MKNMNKYVCAESLEGVHTHTHTHTHTGSLANKGITLIALVITIVILLILSVIILNELTGENGIFKRAKEGKLKTEIAQYEEELNIGILQIQTDKIDKEINMKVIKEEIDAYAKKTENTTIEWKNTEEEELQGIYKGYNFYIDKNYTAHIGEKEEGKKIEKYIKLKGGTQIDSGINQSELLVDNKYQFTLAARIKINREEQQTINHMDILGGHYSSNGFVWEFTGTSTYLVFFVGGSSISIDYTPYYDTWIDIVQTYTNEEFKIYINGELVDSKNNSNFVPYSNIYIGNSYQMENRCMRGSIQSVRIWKTILNSEEVKEINYLVKENNIRKNSILKEMTFENEEEIKEYGIIYGNGFEFLYI